MSDTTVYTHVGYTRSGAPLCEVANAPANRPSARCSHLFRVLVNCPDCIAIFKGEIDG